MYARSSLSAGYGSTGYGCQSFSWSAEQEKWTFLCPHITPDNLFGLTKRVQPSRSALACSFSTLRLNPVLTHGIPPAFHHGVHLFIPPTAIGSVPSSSGHAIAYRWRSLPRVRRRRASSPQRSSSNGCCLFRYHHGPTFYVPLVSHAYSWYSEHVRYRRYRSRCI